MLVLHLFNCMLASESFKPELPESKIQKELDSAAQELFKEEWGNLDTSKRNIVFVHILKQ